MSRAGDEATRAPRPGAAPAAEGARLALLVELLGRGRSVRLRARGGSMRPWLRDGDELLLAPLQRAPRLGEVVAAVRGAGLWVHRVVALRPEGALLRGDACAAPDGLFVPAELLGRVAGVRRDGRRHRLSFLGGPGGRAVLLAAPLIRAALRAAGALRSRCLPDEAAPA